MSRVPCHYSVLQVPRDASKVTIKKSYLRLAKKHHPDLNKFNEKSATITFAKIQSAYAILSDPDKRSEYDFEKYGHLNRKKNKNLRNVKTDISEDDNVDSDGFHDASVNSENADFFANNFGTFHHKGEIVKELSEEEKLEKLNKRYSAFSVYTKQFHEANQVQREEQRKKEEALKKLKFISKIILPIGIPIGILTFISLIHLREVEIADSSLSFDQYGQAWVFSSRAEKYIRMKHLDKKNI